MEAGEAVPAEGESLEEKPSAFKFKKSGRSVAARRKRQHPSSEEGE